MNKMILLTIIDSFNLSEIGKACLIFSLWILLAAALIWLIWLLALKYGSKQVRKNAAPTLKQNVGEDFIGVDASLAELIGKTGTAITDLRPAGKVEINGTRYDATSTGDFIPAGSQIKVVRYEAAQLYIEEYRN